jgi:DNA-binding PadR family transcriptional regulator
MSLEHILLGLLREPASGYDLKSVVDDRIHYFWAAELSQIYPTLQKLERKGLLHSRRAPAKRGPRRRVYQTTRAGFRVLREWLESGFEVGDERVVYLAKLYLMGELADMRKTLRFLKGIRDGFARRAAALDAIERAWAEGDPRYPDSLSPAMFHVLLTLRSGICMMGARLKWCDESIRRVQTRLEKEGSDVRTVSRPSLGAHRGGNHRADHVLGPRGRKQGRPAAR